MNFIQAIVLAIIGSSALASFATFMISRKDKKKESDDEQKKEQQKEQQEIRQELKEIRQEQQESHMALLRIQMMNLMQHEGSYYELLIVAEEYFSKGGDWYMTSFFNRYLEQNNLAKPEWFREEK